ncbi:MAG: putative lipid II flippase FtsW [Patescibacteria group bacterium]
MERRILWLVGGLVLFGLVMLSSAGIVLGEQKFGSSYYFVLHQITVGVLPGLVALGIARATPSRFWRRISPLLLFAVLVLLVLVLIPGFGDERKGAQSWLLLGGISFQPTEFLKLGFILYLAAWLSNRKERSGHWSAGLLPFLVMLGVVALLVGLQPDVGTLAIIFSIAGAVYFAAGMPLRQLGVVVLLGAVLFGAFIAVQPYRLQRIQVAFGIISDPRGSSYQVSQSLIAIGSGGVFGNGFGQSTQKFGFLPEAVGDSIFAIICEELGIVGGMLVLITFGALCVAYAQLARKTDDMYSKLVVVGMQAWIMIQALVNILAMVGVLPLTGVPLPFISFGGTALVALLAGVGMTLAIAREQRA